MTNNGNRAAPRRDLLLGVSATLLAAPAAAQMNAPRAPGAANAAGAESVVARWMLVADVLASDRRAGEWPRAQTMALVAMAMHDALNAIEPRYRRWAPAAAAETAATGASPVVAVAMAAFGVLAARHVIPAMRATAEPSLFAAMAVEPSEARRAAGLALGGAIAAATVARAGALPEVQEFTTSEAPGGWRPTPPSPVLGGIYLERPFLFPDRQSLLGPPPPDLASQRYQAEAEEVRRLGGAGTTERSAAQTEAAWFWAEQSSQRNIMRLLAQRLAAQPPAGGLWDEARDVSILAVAFADTSVLVYEEKRHFAFWRPVTAINLGSAGVRADPAWEAALPTPPHPDYPSAHSADCTAGAVVVAALLGDAPVAYQATDVAGQPTRMFPSLAAAAAECAESRIWAGAHFRAANEEGQRIGRAVAARALESVPPLR